MPLFWLVLTNLFGNVFKVTGLAHGDSSQVWYGIFLSLYVVAMGGRAKMHSNGSEDF
ncbi:MAG: hypothetical protein U0931_37140 [Vulcanimicrobiota bacterium]